MIVKKAIDFEMDQNCYVVFKEESDECIVIDPGNSFEKLINILNENNLKVGAVLFTHCHYDHISGAEKLNSFSAAPFLSGKNCSENIKSSTLNVSVMFGENFVFEVDKTLSDGEVFKKAGFEIKCIETPGHTNCSVCYLIEDVLFSGDTLFLRTTGRWDLPTGDYDVLFYSLQNKLYKMDDDITVYPGHGEKTSIGYEKKFNMSINAQN